MSQTDADPLPSRLKHLIVAQFRLKLAEPDTIPDHTPLIGSELGLDSLDALELAISVEENFNVTIHSQAESLHAFSSIAALTAFIRTRQGTTPVHPAVASIA